MTVLKYCRNLECKIVIQFLFQDVKDDVVVAQQSQVYEPCIHVVVNEWIDHGIAHGQPVEAEEDLLHVFVLGDVSIDKLVDKVAVIRKPTHCEQQDDYDKHLHNLRNQIFF